MESGYSSLAGVAATLFGLVLVSLVFAYTTAISRIDSIGDFSHFAFWVWAAGFSCFLYFSCCFLISFRLMEDETWLPAIAGIATVITISLIISLYKELHWLRIMTLEDCSEFKGLFWTQAILPVIIFPGYDLASYYAAINKFFWVVSVHRIDVHYFLCRYESGDSGRRVIFRNCNSAQL